MDDDTERFIQVEAARRVGKETRRLNDQIAEMQVVLKDCQNKLVQQHAIITQLTEEPLGFGTLVKINNLVDPTLFKPNDEVLVVDHNSPYAGQGGIIVSGLNGEPVVENGQITVRLHDETEERFSIGSDKQSAQIRLSQKKDGTSAVVSIDGKLWEVKDVPDLDLKVGDPVKIKADNSRQIVSRGYDMTAGPICRVLALNEIGVEIEDKGERKLVQNPRGLVLEEGDRVVIDPGFIAIIEALPRDSRQHYKFSADEDVTWDSVGGLEKAKQELKDFLELPYQQPELFEYYNMDIMKGVLLCGAPGCGKTLLARVAASSQAHLHGKDKGGYFYVKSPDILDKWVGNTEAEIRSLFEQGRRFYKENGFKAILTFDEIDAIAPMRGSHAHHTIQDTIVPMLLGEMDGIDSNQTKENPIVFLLTNRPDILDPALTRPGRITTIIKVERPNDSAAVDILNIHTKKVPFEDEATRKGTLIVTCADLFSKTRVLYRINNEHNFTLGDICSGALLANLAQEARMNALRRDIANKTRTGIRLDDFRSAVNAIFMRQSSLNHAYDIQDFADSRGLQASSMQVERCHAAM